eukprot:TRINITY_DN38506_c0_g1_i1.p1 TRINITY_DN38506_c0_g1~~TRINITY_DN38506_c0_g1_i1.p1  ORF type:complete len:384 (-),score=40.32 TRINITY_DN38506_c0_g1_i1:121-1128(-)
MAEAVAEDVLGALLLCSVRDTVAVFSLILAGTVCQRLKQAEAIRAFAAWPSGKQDWMLLVTMGLSGPFLAPLATVLCASWASADTAAVMNALTPGLTALVSTVIGFESPSWYLTVGVTSGSVGGLLVAISASPGSSHIAQGRAPTEKLAGNLAGFASAAFTAIFLLAIRPLVRRSHRSNGNCRDNSEFRGRELPLPAMLVIGLAYAFAACASVTTCVALGAYTAPRLVSWRADDWAFSIYGGVVCGAMNYALITWASTVLPPSVCGLYGALQPPLTAVLAFLVRGDTMPQLGIVGMALVIASLLIISRHSDRELHCQAASSESVLLEDARAFEQS